MGHDAFSRLIALFFCLMDYSQKLTRQEWKQLRTSIVEERGARCENCNAVHRPLQVHHMVYISGLEPWQVPPELLKVLCDVCHKSEHDYQRKLQDFISEMLSTGITYKEIFDLLSAAKIHIYG